MARVAMGRVIRMSVGGAVGGLLSFTLLEPTLRAAEVARAGGALDLEAAASAMQRVFALGGVVGAAIGVSLIVAEEMGSLRIGRLARLTIAGVVTGALCGIGGAFAGQIGFALFVLAHLLVAGRAIGWALMGAAAGLCPGAVTRSPRRTWQGVAGGLLGGGMGGLLFDAIGTLSETGTLSRFVGFLAMGAMIGLGVSLVEEFGKEMWLTVLTGAKEGRAYILTRPHTILGRDELADVPLFGDMNIGRQHTVIAKSGQGASIQAAPGQSVFVNNLPVTQQLLANGDLIALGAHRLKFSSRRAASVSVFPPSTRGMEGMQSGYTSSASTQPLSMNGSDLHNASQAFTASAPIQMPTNTPLATMLEVTDGPNRGQTFTLADGAILGRDPQCDVALTRDAQASRQHARIVWDGATWLIEDGGSSNGTWLNGQRVASADLHPGDDIRIGQTILRVR